jgi:hypothetical protein
MDRRTRNLFAVVLVVVIAITGGAALILGATGGSAPAAPTGTTSADGVVVAVDAAGLGDVHGFTLRETGGSLLDFRLALADPTRFPPGHLAEHQATAEPVRVWYRTDGPTRIAVRIDDLPR